MGYVHPSNFPCCCVELLRYGYREPDIVEMEDLIEYKNEVVKVEGEIISWRGRSMEFW